MASTTSSTGGGTHGACRSSDTGRARQTVVCAGDGPGVEDLRPAVGEQAVADDEAPPTRRQLPGDRFHGVGAATRDDRDGLGTVGRAQDVDDVLHHPDEALRHVVQRTVGEDDRVLEQAIGIDVGARKGHSQQVATPSAAARLERRRVWRVGRSFTEGVGSPS